MKTKGKRNCRHCNHHLRASERQRPACKQNQGRFKECIALLIGLGVIGLVAYLQLREEAPATPPLRITPFTEEDTSPAQAKSIPAQENIIRESISEPAPERSLSAQSLLQFAQSAPAQTQSFPRTRLAPTRTTPTRATPTSYQGTPFLQESGHYPYYVAERRWNAAKKKHDFYRAGMHGSEIAQRGDNRRHFVSENQGNYPEPASGCGPIALLNLYIWYSKFGLLDESISHANPGTYKRLKFKQIDRKLLDIQRQSRTRNGGTNTLAAIVAMDELIQQYAKQKNIRLHFEVKQAPLNHKDFTELSRNYRAGILSVRPKDKITGALLSNHAVLCIRGDTSGMITIANWGEFSHGRLVNRPDGQWFIPKDPSQHELRINQLTTLIPFVPKS